MKNYKRYPFSIVPFCVFMLLLIPLVASASLWKLVGETDDAEVYIDVTSISSRGKLKKAWFRADYKSLKTSASYPFKQYQSTKSLEYYNCGERTGSKAQLILYSGRSGSGGAVDSYSASIEKLEFSEIVPDTAGEAMFEYVCGKRENN